MRLFCCGDWSSSFIRSLTSAPFSRLVDLEPLLFKLVKLSEQWDRSPERWELGDGSCSHDYNTWSSPRPVYRTITHPATGTLVASGTKTCRAPFSPPDSLQHLLALSLSAFFFLSSPPPKSSSFTPL